MHELSRDLFDLPLYLFRLNELLLDRNRLGHPRLGPH